MDCAPSGRIDNAVGKAMDSPEGAAIHQPRASPWDNAPATDQDELRQFLDRCRMTYEERYVWD